VCTPAPQALRLPQIMTVSSGDGTARQATFRRTGRGPGAGRLGLVEVFGLDAEELVDGGAQGGVGGELRVGR